MKHQEKILDLSKEEVNHLLDKYEIRNDQELFSWAIKFLYDISKAEESGWYMRLFKGEFDENFNFTQDESYKNVFFTTDMLSPKDQGQPRIFVEILERMKIDD